LRCAQPIAGAKPKLLNTFHPADPSSQFRAQQAGIGGFVRQSSNSRQLLVDRICGQTAGFQVHAVPHNYDTVEREARLGTIPGDELIDGILVHAARGWRPEAGEPRLLSTALLQ
jgi:hypothetical protein